MRNVIRTAVTAAAGTVCAILLAAAGSAHSQATASGPASGPAFAASLRSAHQPRIAVTMTRSAAPGRDARGVLNRVVCDNQQVPGRQYWCEVADIDPKSPTVSTVGRREGEPANIYLDQQIHQVYNLLGDVYNFYFTRFGYDLTDNIGLGMQDDPTYPRVLSAAVNMCDGTVVDPGSGLRVCNGDNAFWQPAPDGMVGGSMSIGSGLAGLSDVIAHEMQHGVTDLKSNLSYQGQSGAINESISDIFGELIDRSKQLKDYGKILDDWTIGEGHMWSSVASKPVPWLRSLKDPYSMGVTVKPIRMRGQASSCKGYQPDRMSSPCWDTDPGNEDYGGVHTNSGVGNKAAYLMSVGGTFNGRTIKGMGDDATAELWWAVLPRLWATTNYYQLGNRLMDVCPSLEQAKTLPAGACADTVLPAISATEMNLRRVAFSPLLTSVKSGTVIRPIVSVTDGLRTGATRPMSNLQAYLQLQQPGGTWISVASAYTDTSGKAKFAYTLRNAGVYRLFLPAQGAAPAVTGTATTINLRK